VKYFIESETKLRVTLGPYTWGWLWVQVFGVAPRSSARGLSEITLSPSNLATKCTCRCADISYCFTSSSSWNNKESICPQSWLYCLKFALGDNGTPRGDLQVKNILETSIDSELKNWRFSFIDFVLYGIPQDDPKEAVVIKRKAPWFYYNMIT